MQYVKTLASESSELEKGNILTVLRSISRDDKVAAATTKVERQSSVITSDLVQQFEKASAGDKTVQPLKYVGTNTTTRSVEVLSSVNSKDNLDLGEHTTLEVRQQADIIGPAKRPNTFAGFETTQTQNSLQESNGTPLSPMSPSRTTEMLAKEVQEKIKANELFKEQEKIKKESMKEKEIITLESKNINGYSNSDESLCRPSTVVRQASRTPDGQSSALPQWKVDLIEKQKAKKELASPNDSLISPTTGTSQSPSWIAESERRKTKFSPSGEPIKNGK